MKKYLNISLIKFFFIYAIIPGIIFIAGCANENIDLEEIQEVIIKGEPEIEEAVICKGIDESYTPIEPTAVFPEGTKSIFLLVKFKNFTTEDSLKVIWYYLDIERQLSIQEYSPEENGSGAHYFNIKNPDSFLAGNYNAEIYFNNQLYKDMGFRIE